uniref:Amino acid transporter n=1 Tax=Ixodes ricinus TaxID=34613 RepID=V5GM56_IXORI
MVEFFSVLNVLSMKLAYLVMWYFPIGVVFLLCASIGRGDDLGEHAFNIGVYIGTVMTGLAIHSLVVLPLIYYAFVRKNPLVFAKNLLHAFVTAFGTSDSVATLPVTFMCLEQNNNVGPSGHQVRCHPLASAFNLGRHCAVRRRRHHLHRQPQRHRARLRPLPGHMCGSSTDELREPWHPQRGCHHHHPGAQGRRHRTCSRGTPSGR